MKAKQTLPENVDVYIAAAAKNARPLLHKIRKAIREAAPDAEEIISYRMPAFRQGGILIYFAAFKNHIGVFPPIKGDEKLIKAALPYAGAKGNLQFPLDKPIPYDLIERIVKHRVKQNDLKKSPKPQRKTARKAASIRIS